MEPRDRQVEQLTEALEHRTVIGQALGLLMERFAIGDDEAFAYLVRCSSHQNRKLYDIAVEFVETRRLPDAVTDVTDVTDGAQVRDAENPGRGATATV